ncbi:hypothetical protein OH77DRAFT_1001923 [Trametes cingulata]|nr:hypothetical protein OH77DRAFT_1001923 [Trametes cingulata]
MTWHDAFDPLQQKSGPHLTNKPFTSFTKVAVTLSGGKRARRNTRNSVIDYLADDWRVLARCVFVCSVWKDRAGYNLSRGVTLEIGELKAQASFPDLADFVRIFCAESKLSDLIVSLTMKGTAKSAMDNTGALPQDLDLSPLRRLRSLTLRHLHIRLPVAFRTLCTSLPLLEELTVDDVTADFVPDRSLWPAAHGEEYPAYPPLTTVRVRCTSSHPTIADVLRDDLRLPWLSDTLRTLSIDFPVGKVEGWEKTIRALQGTQRELRVSLWPRNTDAGIEWHSPALYEAIAGCTRLQSLTLHISEAAGSYFSQSGIPSIFSSVARWLASPACLFATSLERFTLCLPFPVEVLALRKMDTVAVIGRATRAELYPRLRRLRFIIFDESAPVSTEGQRKGILELTKALQKVRQTGGGSVTLEVDVVPLQHEWENEYSDFSGGYASRNPLISLTDNRKEEGELKRARSCVLMVTPSCEWRLARVLPQVVWLLHDILDRDGSDR